MDKPITKTPIHGEPSMNAFYCATCKFVFNNKEMRPEIRLSCGHVICATCVRDVTYRENKTIHCLHYPLDGGILEYDPKNKEPMLLPADSSKLVVNLGQRLNKTTNLECQDHKMKKFEFCLAHHCKICPPNSDKKVCKDIHGPGFICQLCQGHVRCQRFTVAKFKSYMEVSKLLIPDFDKLLGRIEELETEKEVEGGHDKTYLEILNARAREYADLSLEEFFVRAPEVKFDITKVETLDIRFIRLEELAEVLAGVRVFQKLEGADFAERVTGIWKKLDTLLAKPHTPKVTDSPHDPSPKETKKVEADTKPAPKKDAPKPVSGKPKTAENKQEPSTEKLPQTGHPDSEKLSELAQKVAHLEKENQEIRELFDAELTRLRNEFKAEVEGLRTKLEKALSPSSENKAVSEQ